MYNTTNESGSLPFNRDYKRFLEGSKVYKNLAKSQSSELAKYFEIRIVEALIDKIKTGIDVVNYPQFRDMNKMFLDTFQGLQKAKKGYHEIKKLSISNELLEIKEVNVIKNNLRKITTETGKFLKLRVCITGPYTLAGFFTYRDKEIFSRIGKLLSKIVEHNVFNQKYGSVKLISVDEPTFGFIDDPLLDMGTGGREDLLQAWENIFHKAKVKNIDTCIHLHNTTNNFFWDVKSLKIIESHVNDPIYFSDNTKKFLNTTDKFLKASISISHFDNLIRNYILNNIMKKNSNTNINQKLSEIWRNIKRGKQDPTIYLEDINLMQKRLAKILERIGLERILYAGPECGLKSFPTYDVALTCLKQTAAAVSHFNKKR